MTASLDSVAAPQDSNPRVVVVGGGFAGFFCAQRLLRLVRRGRLAAEVVLVAPDDYLLYTPLLPDVAGGLVDARHVGIPLVQALPGLHYVGGLVDSVDLEGRTLTVDGTGTRSLSWSRLVLTPGSVTKLPDIPGLAEHAHGLKSLAEALYLRDHLLGELEASATETDGEARRAARTVVVVGASYAGTELVSQLRALADVAADRHGFEAREVRFVLLDVAESVMPEVGGTLGGRALKVLRQRGVEVRLGTTLTEVTENSVTLSDGSRLDTHTVAWVTGVEAHPLVKSLGTPLHKGRLMVNPELGLPGYPDVFAAGDAAAVPDLTKPPGTVTPPTAQHAQRQGHALARNVAASLGCGEAKPYRHHDLGLVVDLGPHYAVADPLGVHLSGLAAKAVTRAYHLAALPFNANRFSVGVDWLADLFTPRPTLRLGLIDPVSASFAVSEHRPDPAPPGP